MNKLWVPVVASMLGLASFSIYAEEVKLTDHDRMELRQRADSLRSSNALGRTHETRMDRSAMDRPMHVTHSKKQAKHMRHSKAKRHA